MSLEPDLLEILVCPRCQGRLEAVGDGSGLDCPSCRLRYPVRDGIPIMLPDEAAPLP